MKNYFSKISFLTLLAFNFLNANMIELIKGWNAVGLNSKISLSEIKSQLGNALIMIQSPDGKESYNSKLPNNLPQTFKSFKIGIGYWIKVSEDKNLSYQPDVINGNYTIYLVKGWNLIAPLSSLSLSEIKSQLGNALIMIQSPDGKESYNSKLPNNLPQTFKSFKANSIAYWIKVNSDTQLVFKLSNILPNVAVNGELHNSTIKYNDYTIKVLTDSKQPNSTSQNVILYFKINGNDEQLGVNNNYPKGTYFQIAVYDSNGKLIAVSKKQEYNSNDGYINFGNISLSENNESQVVENNVETNTTNLMMYPPTPEINSNSNVMTPPSAMKDQ